MSSASFYRLARPSFGRALQVEGGCVFWLIIVVCAHEDVYFNKFAGGVE